jgi:hypothetical protein
MTSYKPSYYKPSYFDVLGYCDLHVTLDVCQTCGALVADADDHNDFHDTIDEMMDTHRAAKLAELGPYTGIWEQARPGVYLCGPWKVCREYGKWSAQHRLPKIKKVTSGHAPTAAFGFKTMTAARAWVDEQENRR